MGKDERTPYFTKKTKISQIQEISTFRRISREDFFWNIEKAFLFLEPFLPKVWYFFGLDTSTSDKQQVPNVKSPKKIQLREIFAKKEAIFLKSQYT